VGGPNGALGPPWHETQHAAIEMKKLGIAPSSLRYAALNARELPSRTSVSGHWFLRTLVRQPTAGCVRAGGIDGYAPFFYAGNLTLFVHHKRRAVGHAELRDQNPVRLRNLAHVIAEDGVGDVEFLFPVRQGRREISADRQNLGIIFIKICDTRLVRV
jgi:hypothetical protein